MSALINPPASVEPLSETSLTDLDALPTVAEPAAPAPDPVVALLERARDRLERGWTRGRYFDGEGNYCLVGAIDREAGMTRLVGPTGNVSWVTDRLASREAICALNRALARNSRPSVQVLTSFNDVSGQRAVLALIDTAIRLRRYWTGGERPYY